MKGMYAENTVKKEKGFENERTRLKTSPGGQTLNQSPKKINQETIMIFGFEQYPFPNEQASQTPLLKTIVNLDLTTEKLQKVIKLTHPNIIGLRKIVRSSPKEAYQGSKHRSYYSFYYELVQYGLRELVEDPNKNMRLFNEIKGYNLRQILMNVTEYLKDAGIYYVSRIEDIGVHIDGTIKVYIPPNVVFESIYNPNIHRAILTITEWWDNSLASIINSKFKKDKKIFQLQPPRLSDNGDLQLDDPSMKSSTLERELGELLGDDEEEMPAEEEQNATQLKQSTNSYCSQVTKMGSIRLDKFKKIDEEVKFIRSRLNEKTKRKHKESDVTHEKREVGKSKSSLNLFDSQQIKPKDKEDFPEKIDKIDNYYPRQPIQQNIHTINIYNHTPATPINPNVFTQLPTPKYMPKSKNYQVYYDHNLDPEFFRDQDEEYSQDTYDIEFQNQFEMPNPSPNSNYRHTLFAPPQRELSEYSEHCHKKSREGWGNEMKPKSNKPQVVQVCNKNVTQSAGPLQFKSFVNKIIKPQFLAKKSNIYEDPGEDGQEESDRDFEKAKKRQESFSKRQLNSSNHRHFSTDKSLSDLKKVSNKSVTDFGMDESIKHDIKRINSQHDFAVGKGKTMTGPQSHIEEKVKKALQKTKNAIALLNRVKSNKSNIKTLSSQQS